MFRPSIVFILVGIFFYILGLYQIAGFSLKAGKVFLYFFFALAAIAINLKVIKRIRSRKATAKKKFNYAQV